MVLELPGPTLPEQHPELSTKAHTLYDTLAAVACRVRDERGYSPHTTVVHVFCPGEVVAWALGMARSTLYRKLKELRALGLVEGRAHYATHKGRTRADGMVWCVRVGGEARGPLRVSYDALKATYRSLSADIEAGRTAWRQMAQSKESPIGQDPTQLILEWALPPSNSTPVKESLTVPSERPDLEAILDVPHVDPADQPEAVDRAARALCVALGDARSHRYFCKVLWAAQRAVEATGQNRFWQIYTQAQRARADVLEGWARRGGAVFVARMRS